MKRYLLAIMALLSLLFTAGTTPGNNTEGNMNTQTETPPVTAKALFAGGCFWCMEKPFESLDGVVSATSGYAGGTTENPTYQDYGTGGHTEVVQVIYNPQKVSYQRLLDTFWHQIDPTDAGGQFVDRGHEYISAVYVYDNEQKYLAQSSKEGLEASGILGKPVVTPILDAPPFWPAEDYHQDYYKENPIRYSFYRSRSGRDEFLHKTWDGVQLDLAANRPEAEQTKADLKKKLTPLQYHVTQEEGTEPAFANDYWDNKKAGLYVDIVSGEPLFSSTDKYDSGTGWPSFTKPLVKGNIVERQDRSLFPVMTEIRSKQGNSHLGHVFDDGPQPTGLRYCMNSAALRFIPVDKLAESGYQEYVKLFK